VAIREIFFPANAARLIKRAESDSARIAGRELAFDHFDIRFRFEIEMPMSAPLPVAAALII
jgi:hypothetical protein